jgi:hypothetical protein
MHAPVYAGLGSRVGRLPNLLQEMHEYVRRRALLETAYARSSHGTQRLPSPPPALCVFWTKSTEPIASPSAGWTGRNRACDTIGSRDTLRTPVLVSASSFGSHVAALTRYTSPPQTVGNSGSTRQRFSSPVRFQKYHPASTVPNCQRSVRSV